MNPRHRHCRWMALALLGVGCGGADPAPPVGGDAAGDLPTDRSGLGTSDGVAGDDAPPVVVCERPGTRFRPGTPAFRDATDAWGLQGVMATRISVTDVDGDGWADLLVRDGGGAGDTFTGRPDDVRSRWLLRNHGARGFDDVTSASGLLVPRGTDDRTRGRPGGIFVSGDIDNDGDLDVYVATGRGDPTDPDAPSPDLMLNAGDGTFTFGPPSSGARFGSEPNVPSGATFVDFDRDGFLDLWIVQRELAGPVGLQDQLLRGDGVGAFWSVTQRVGLITQSWDRVGDLNAGIAHSWGWASAACDLDGDGSPELLASSYGRFPNHLWRATAAPDGGVWYTNASVASGYAFDHRLDWTTDQNARCWCRDNPADPGCDTPPDPDPALCDQLRAAFGDTYRWDHAHGRELFQLGGVTGTTICADVDNDGDLDLFNTEIVHQDVGASSDPTEWLVNTGAADLRFERPGPEATGLDRPTETSWDRGDMTAAVFDFDNDGWLDVYVGVAEYPGNRGLLYHQAGPLAFDPVAFADFFEHRRSHGVAVADLDRDGDLDVVVGHSHFRCDGADGADCYPTRQLRLFENLTADGGGSNWVQLSLEGGAGSNRAAIGARVRVTSEGVTQTAEVDGGHGRFGLQRDLVQHFGLGAGCVAEVEIRWPDASGTVQRFTVAANARYRVVQGDEPAAAP